MPNEGIICCCGASSWTKVIAWFQIVISVILIIGYSISLASIIAINTDDLEIPNKSSIVAATAISLVMSVLGLVMGVILLKGTNQKRVGYIRAWLIYGIASILTSIVSLIISVINTSDGYSVAYTIGTSIVGLAINAFCIAVVYIHMKEINEGVFTPGNQYI